ncbi:hypothetical protein B0H13DRAFT_1901284 [Mycena leptocephala]|nr:hypothetical protein B0H13DRAFT_1901284 [Mycena leptocephala]
MITRVKQFLTRARPRTRKETCDELRTQFTLASEVGGQAAFKRQKTKSGVKDTFQGAFLDKIFGISTKKGLTRMAKAQSRSKAGSKVSTETCQIEKKRSGEWSICNEGSENLRGNLLLHQCVGTVPTPSNWVVRFLEPLPDAGRRHVDGAYLDDGSQGQRNRCEHESSSLTPSENHSIFISGSVDSGWVQ